jgi:sortase (surface protein transpeptidase)
VSPKSPRAAHKERRPRAALLGVAAIALGLLLAPAAIVAALGSGHARPPATSHIADPAQRPLQLATTPAAPTPASPATARPVVARGPAKRASVPVRIDIPSIGVRAPVIRLGLNPDHTLQVPSDFAVTGWWADGPRPGEIGPAVIVGHVDSKTGPAVFYRLGQLRRGDAIRVRGADGRLARFTVQRLATYPKDRFPTQTVYGPTRGPVLRLITCSGQFDRSTGHYLSNTVVFASGA